MATKIRLKRIGRRNRPFYRLVVMDERARRDGAAIEQLGWFNPLELDDEKNYALKEDRVLHWLQEGAQTTETAHNLLKRTGLAYRWHLIKQGLSEAAVEKEMKKWALEREVVEKLRTDKVSKKVEENQKAEDEQRDEQKVAVTEETPVFKNIYMKNIIATNSGKAAFFMGLPEKSLENVTLENAMLEADEGITVIDTRGLQLKNVKVISKKTEALIIYNSNDIVVEGFTFSDNGKKAVKVLGTTSSEIKLELADFNNVKQQISIAKSLSKETVSFH